MGGGTCVFLRWRKCVLGNQVCCDVKFYNVCFCVSVCENCPRILRKDFESSVCAEYEVAGAVRDLLSLICSADVIPGRYDVVIFIMGNSPDHIPRLERFGDSKFCALWRKGFLKLDMVRVMISVLLLLLQMPLWNV